METNNQKCQECGETEHKLWCSKYEGLKLDPIEREAEKQLDTTYKEEMAEIEIALKEAQVRCPLCGDGGTSDKLCKRCEDKIKAQN